MIVMETTVNGTAAAYRERYRCSKGPVGHVQRCKYTPTGAHIAKRSLLASFPTRDCTRLHPSRKKNAAVSLVVLDVAGVQVGVIV